MEKLKHVLKYEPAQKSPTSEESPTVEVDDLVERMKLGVRQIQV